MEVPVPRSRNARVTALCAVLCLLTAGCPPKSVLQPTQPLAFSYAHEWRAGYALAYLQDDTSVLWLRWRSAIGLWRDGGRLGAGTPAGDHAGVGLGQATGDARMLLGYTKGGNLRMYRAQGLAFDLTQPPSDQLTGVASAPAITHVRDDTWLVAFARADSSIELRPFVQGRFQNPVHLTTNASVTRTYVSGIFMRPAIAYFNGLFLMVWASNRTDPYLYITAQYQPGDAALSAVATGEVPLPTPAHERAAAPALSHDGADTFYLATSHGRQVGNRIVDYEVSVYHSPDGRSWRMHSTGQMRRPHARLGIAARANGEVLLALVGDRSRPDGRPIGRMLRYQNGGWYEPDNFEFVNRTDWAFAYRPEESPELGLVRHYHQVRVRSREAQLCPVTQPTTRAVTQPGG